MNIEGFVEIEARDSITGELKDSRSRHNLIFDSLRMILFFNHYAAGSYPRILLENVYLYLSETAGPITQSFSPVQYAQQGPYSGTYTYPIDRRQVLITYPTIVISATSPTRTLRCVGLRDASYYSACPIDPPIIHDSATTLYIHYYVRITLSADDNLFGYETLIRDPYAAKYYYGGGYVGYSDGYSYTVAMPNYKKHFYVSPLNRRLIPADGSAGGGGSYFLFSAAVLSSTDDSSNYVMKGYVAIPQWWAGPYGGSYECGRNSGLGAGCIYDPHISRVFAHKASVSTKIFYDSTEADVPESEGTLSTDVTGCVYQPNPLVLDPPYNPDGLKYPSVFRMLFTATGDVTTATYNIQEYVMPETNYFPYPGGCLDSLNYYNYNYSIQVTLKHMYVSKNREWGTYCSTACSPGYGLQLQDKPYVFVINNGLSRPYLGFNFYPPAYIHYCIDNYGYLYHTRSTGVTTLVHSVDMNSLEPTPPFALEFDLSVVCSGHGITNITGLTFDDDNDWLWVATNVGFVKVDYAASGGTTYTFYNHDTVNFGLYMSVVAQCTIYDPWNGRFQAEGGTLTWVQSNDPSIVWHWTGGVADARSIDVPNYSGSIGISNLFVDLTLALSAGDLGVIGVVRNGVPADGFTISGGTTPASGPAYPAFIRIPSLISSPSTLVVTNQSTRNIASGYGYSCAMELGQFWYMVSSNGGTAYKGRIDIVGATGVPFTDYYMVPYMIYNQTVSGSTIWSGNSMFASPNRSFVEGVCTIMGTTGSNAYWTQIVLYVDNGPIYWGWDGANWVKSLANQPSKTTHFAMEPIPRGVLVGFNDGGLGDSYRLYDYYSFGVNPKGIYIDNLQTSIVDIAMYGYHAEVVTRNITVPVGSIYSIPEQSSTVTESKTVMRGWTAAGSDYVHDAITSVSSVVQGGTTYIAGVDYNLVSSACIDWLGVAEPAAGTSYTVNYTFNNFINMVAWMCDSHPKVKFLDYSGDPLGTVISVCPTWVTGKTYSAGQYVTLSGYNYFCILSNASIQPGVTAGWATYWTQTSLTVGQVVGGPPDGHDITKEVRYDYAGTITFYPGHEGETVEVRYAWLSRTVV